MTNRVRWSGDSRSQDSQSSDSDRSRQSQETAPTEYSFHPRLQRRDTCYPRLETTIPKEYYTVLEDPKDSVETYATTIPDEDEVSEVDDDESNELLCIPDEEYRAEAIPATPRDFAELFPSADRMSILHDDATLDGNMNLRLDTQIELRNGQKRPLTLFHLRMHDLKSREFSLRRYCRDSGREVCHSVRRYHKSGAERNSGLQKSFTSALASLRRHADSQAPTTPGLKRTDSGYASMFGNEEYVHDSKPSKSQFKRPTNTMKLEFSNYAQVDLKRRGAGSGKRYEFEYWGFHYVWKRQVKQDGSFTEVSYHLIRNDKESSLAQIIPALLTTSQAENERSRGGWVPPCSFWLNNDDEIFKSPDVADVVVATGLMTLVDDCIKMNWPSRRTRPLILPIANASPFRMQLEYIGPRRLIDEVFNRIGNKLNDPPGAQSSTQRRRSAAT